MRGDTATQIDGRSDAGFSRASCAKSDPLRHAGLDDWDDLSPGQVIEDPIMASTCSAIR